MLERVNKRKIMHAVVVNNGVAYTGGLGANDIDADMESQTAQICAKIEDVLASVGSDKTKIIRAQIFLTDMTKKPDMDRAWLAWCHEDDLPARCTVGVADLGDPRRLIEVVITAAV